MMIERRTLHTTLRRLALVGAASVLASCVTQDAYDRATDLAKFEQDKSRQMELENQRLIEENAALNAQVQDMSAVIGARRIRGKAATAIRVDLVLLAARDGLRVLGDIRAALSGDTRVDRTLQAVIADEIQLFGAGTRVAAGRRSAGVGELTRLTVRQGARRRDAATR